MDIPATEKEIVRLKTKLAEVETKMEEYLKELEYYMTIQYASDLHLKFPENKKFLKANPLQSEAEVLSLAGDIMPFAVMNEHKDFFNYISDHFETTYWIPGNHEYYYSNMAEKSGPFKESSRQNVYLLNNTVEQLKDVRFVFSTLWSKINPVRIKDLNSYVYN